MSSNRQIALALLVLALGLLTCSKVPLTTHYGHFDLSTAHWFENEGVAYVFFSLDEAASLTRDGIWEMEYSVRAEDGGVEHHEFAKLDLSQGVHVHRLVRCGSGRLCGSYSFRSDLPLVSVSIRYRYDGDSPLAVDSRAAVQNHQDGETSEAYSAVTYGVFDQTNGHVQVRVRHNFGTPSHAQVAQYGLERRFHVSPPVLFDMEIEAVATAREESSSPYAFPAKFCEGHTSADDPEAFAGQLYWSGTALDTANGASGSCFEITYLDKVGGELVKAPAYGLKNPVLDRVDYEYEPLLKDVVQIPVALAYCQDDDDAKPMTDGDFFNYQRYILGMKNQTIDVCFRIGEEDEFADKFKSHLSDRLSTAMAENPGQRDFIFVIAFHHVFSAEFRQFHQTVAEQLNVLIEEHRKRVSPRLVGAMVYESDTSFRLTAAQRQNLMWCPQELPDNLVDTAEDPTLFNQNCTNMAAGDLDLEVINFVIPLGPFPSRRNYRRYVDEYGDKGLAGGPSLVFRAVPTTGNTRQEGHDRITFFDSERLSLGVGEALRTCHTNDESFIRSAVLRFRTPQMPASTPSLTIAEAELLWRENVDGGEFNIGIGWQLPFWGAIRYTQTLSGNVVSVIPFQTSSRTSEELGDSIWVQDAWKMIPLEFCRAFCDHPFFDQQGVYQVQLAWRDQASNSCPTPGYPRYQEGG